MLPLRFTPIQPSAVSVYVAQFAAAADEKVTTRDLRELLKTMLDCAIDKRRYEDFVAVVQAVEAVDHSTHAVDVQGMDVGDGAVVAERAGVDVVVDAMLAKHSTQDCFGTLEEGDGTESLRMRTSTRSSCISGSGRRPPRMATISCWCALPTRRGRS